MKLSRLLCSTQRVWFLSSSHNEYEHYESTHVAITILTHYLFYFIFGHKNIFPLKKQMNFLHKTSLTVLSDLFLGKMWLQTG